MEIKTNPAVPVTEVSREFLQGMADRMGVSYCKYGPVADGFPHKVNAIDTLKARLDQYTRTGNTEFLMDVANYAMIEFMRPKHPQAHYRATDSRDSPGRVWNGEVNPVADRNVPERL
jgi:hypothetical protein